MTWNTRSSRLGRPLHLRGCIGIFEPMPIRGGIAQYALISAFQDSRFKRITSDELDSLECGYVSPSFLHATCKKNMKFETNHIDNRFLPPFPLSFTLQFPICLAPALEFLYLPILRMQSPISIVHGIQITFPHPSLILSSSSGTPTPLSSTPNLPHITSHRTFSATYLPEVMVEQRWDRFDAINCAIQKAGWEGLVTEDLRRSIKLRRFKSEKCSVSWHDYWIWRKENQVES